MKKIRLDIICFLTGMLAFFIAIAPIVGLGNYMDTFGLFLFLIAVLLCLISGILTIIFRAKFKYHPAWLIIGLGFGIYFLLLIAFLFLGFGF